MPKPIFIDDGELEEWLIDGLTRLDPSNAWLAQRFSVPARRKDWLEISRKLRQSELES